mgnify:CR=1 FL=1
MADDRADPILQSYDPEAEAHITALINGDIEYVPEEDEEDVSSYLNLDGEGEGEGRQGDDEGRMEVIETFASGGQTTNDDLELATTSGEVYIYIEPLVIQTY